MEKTKNQLDLDNLITKHMTENQIVGLSACRVQEGEVIWAKGYGWADMAAQKPMTPDTIQNIASISKTFTCTALMQLWEQGKFQLDDPVNDYLPFQVKHPKHSTSITFHQLLIHTSAIADGNAYEESYACGDPSTSLAEWIQGYLVAGGKFYDPEANFHSWEPGTNWGYSNVAYGLLGYLVETLSGESFTHYCREHIFKPLGMDQTGWLLSEIDISNHAVPHVQPEGSERMKPLFAVNPDPENKNDPLPLCLYSFPNLSDGLVRTSARQLALFAAAFSKPNVNGIPLKPETMQRCFTPQIPSQEVAGVRLGLGLTWFNYANLETPDDILYWMHDGGDPGVHTRMQLSLKSRGAVTILTNSSHSMESMNKLSELIWQIG